MSLDRFFVFRWRNRRKKTKKESGYTSTPSM